MQTNSTVTVAIKWVAPIKGISPVQPYCQRHEGSMFANLDEKGNGSEKKGSETKV